MDLKIREMTPQDPTMAEAIGWTGRTILFNAALFMELIGCIDRSKEILEKGVGVFAIGGICEVIRQVEHRRREAPESTQES